MNVGDTVTTTRHGDLKFPKLRGQTGQVVKHRRYGTCDVHWSGEKKPWVMFPDEIQTTQEAHRGQ